MPTRWCPVAEKLPARAGKYVVEIDAGFDMVYLSTRSFNPENAYHERWLNMGMGERVTDWLDGLLSVGECARYAAASQSGGEG